ncbi:DUF1631 domain-containing protein [Breoghania sp. L-A4]|uniref:DUF1631 domain-containing protein n=1 Tax=Breoghania sp. L-A4 TaxID=2304600 RepID=UPI0013C36852|nr:DUF1631 domain-containing protein [Breoghania sp. L-A4]
MNRIIWADTLSDYALAASAHRRLGAFCDAAACYPLLSSASGAARLQAALRPYGSALTAFSEIVRGADPADRGRFLAAQLEWSDATPISLAPDAPPSALLDALMRSLETGRPIVFDAAATGAKRPPAPSPSIDGARLMIVNRNSALSLPAALYADATGRRLITLETLEDLEPQLSGQRPASVMLASDRHDFTKSRLQALLAWSQGADGPADFGILSGRSAKQASGIVARLLMHRDFHAGGQSLMRPPDLEPIPAAAMTPMEYYVIGAHGNEMHLDHMDDEVLCGANAAPDPSGFDCTRNCPYDNRFAAREIPAHALLLLSCDAFTLADGLAPPGVNLLMSLLDGMAASVLAPFKHVQFNEGLILLAGALLKGGFSLGGIARRLNERARNGTLPDPAYLVLGDPELTMAAQDPIVAARVAPEPGGLVLELRSNGAPALETTIAYDPDDTDGPLPPLALEPLGETLRDPDIFYTLTPRPAARALTITLFARDRLPKGPLLFRVEQAARLGPVDHDDILGRLNRLSLISEIGLDNRAARCAKASILSFLRAAAGFPRPVELAMGQSMVRNIDALVAADFKSLRRASLRAMLEELEHKRVWISQRYAHAYPHIARAGPRADGVCPHCAEHTTCWRYEDTCLHFPPRRLWVCNQCGIIADVPAEPTATIALATVAALPAPTQRQTFTIANCTQDPLGIGYCLHFNAWGQLGIKADGNIGEATLAPGEEIERTATFHFPEGFPDDVVSMQFFAMTDAMDLYFLSQKMRAQVRHVQRGQTP